MPGSARGSTNLGYEPGALFLKFFGKFRVGATTPNWYPDTNLHFYIFQGTPNLRSNTNLRFDIFQVTPTGEGGVKQLVPDTMLTNCWICKNRKCIPTTALGPLQTKCFSGIMCLRPPFSSIRSNFHGYTLSFEHSPRPTLFYYIMCPLSSGPYSLF